MRSLSRSSSPRPAGSALAKERLLLSCPWSGGPTLPARRNGDALPPRMPYFLLTFGDASRPPVKAVVIEAPSMFQAHMTAVVRRLAPGVPFGESLKLTAKMMAAIATRQARSARWGEIRTYRSRPPEPRSHWCCPRCSLMGSPDGSRCRSLQRGSCRDCSKDIRRAAANCS